MGGVPVPLQHPHDVIGMHSAGVDGAESQPAMSGLRGGAAKGGHGGGLSASAGRAAKRDCTRRGRLPSGQ